MEPVFQICPRCTFRWLPPHCKRKALLYLLMSSQLLISSLAAQATEPLRSGKAETVGIDPAVLVEIDALVEEAIASGKVPGCVVLVARRGVVVWERAYGWRSVQPKRLPNSLSTIYDLASVAKPVATATAVALLLEDGRLGLEDRVADYLPAFSKEGKSDVTVRDLLTHVSGLSPYLDMVLVEKKYGPGPNPDAVISEICSLPKAYDTGKSCVYGCLNFVLLARIVEKIAGEPMESLLKRRVWQPLGMEDTGFLLTEEQRKRAAPTLPEGSPDHCGEVHDPLARYYTTPERCCGNAGLFSSARDLAIFAQMLLNRGCYGGVRILKPKTVDLFTTAQTPAGLPRRGLGWDIDSPAAPQARGGIIPAECSFGHTGFTGSSLWIDRRSGTFFILLSNRTHMEKGDVAGLRTGIGNIVGRSIDIYQVKDLEAVPAN